MKDNYTVNFIVKESQSLKLGLKLGVMTSGDADANINLVKKVF